MDSDKCLERLFRYASEYKFRDFSDRFAELAPQFPAEALRDAHLIAAQIKLFAADETLLDDLEKIAEIEGPPRFPCLSECWLPDSPNRFIVFKKTRGAVRDFLQNLPRVEELLSRWYAEAGASMARQVRSEVLYFSGAFEEARRLAEKQLEKSRERRADAIPAQYVRFRCCLAMGLGEEAEACMLDMIRMARVHPECLGPYRVVRDWANLTTGWSGDTPRFCEVPDGGAQPVLEDRLAAIRTGISRLSPLEEPFVEYAEREYGEAYTVRQYYMDIFHALYWFQVGDPGQAEAHFMRAYQISVASDLVMPFVEYGSQIIPLLRHIEGGSTVCSQEWIARIRSLAEGYEQSLHEYRG
ncbi:hypothetical protein LJC31_01645 [Synergistaceae bacterium OttesenSCG-928-I11]|nr:hypothetical protein [Synergistaceae bacterium OttesenSCG-928-I11]